MPESIQNKIKVLIIDDDIKYCRLVSSYLSSFGYEVNAIHNGPEGVLAAINGLWQAIMLDVMLPNLNGFEVLKKIRERSEIPILMLTALGEESDRIVGLELGADDYLPKTASPRELLARLRALLRRTSRSLSNPSGLSTKELIVGPLSINASTRLASLNSELLSLTPVEFDLLLFLAQSQGRVCSREDMINEIRDRNYDVSDRSIDVHISALRRKLKDNPKNPRFIHTIRTAGYRLTYMEVEQ